MSGARRRGSAGDDATNGSPGGSSFADAVGDDVRPLPPGPERTDARNKSKGKGERAQRRSRSEGQPVEFVRPDADEPRLGHAPGVQRRVLRRLGSGAIAAERTLDLHQLRADAARAELARELRDAHESGVRCVLVIHGRGAHSEGDPVLKRELPAWLAAPDIGNLVRAFAPARDHGGGSGAVYVLLGVQKH